MASNRYTPDQVKAIVESGEPIFILRAKDIFSPITIEYWAALMQKSNADPSLIALAREQAVNIKKWQGDNGFKVPDGDKKESQEDGKDV
jgi:hypothetical protein